MERYLLDYNPGSKGDFLCNFLNNIDIDNNLDKNNRSRNNYSFLKHEPTLWNENFDRIKYENDFRIFLEEYEYLKIFPCHMAWNIPLDILEKYNIKIIHLYVEEYYRKSSLLESYIKNLFVEINPKKRKKIDTNKIEYNFDIILLDNDLEINNKNRVYMSDLLFTGIRNNNLDEIFKEYRVFNYFFDKPSFFKQHDIIKENIDNNHNKKSSYVTYSDLWIKKDFSHLQEILEFDFNKDLLANNISKTWLPEEFNLWGKTWRMKDYGYITS